MSVRSPVPWMYGLVFAEGGMLAALFPLVPDFKDKLSISEIQVGAIYSAFGIAIVLTSVPAGVLADRISARAVTIAAGGLLAVSAVGHGVAVDFWSLFA